ncbi:MAG: hypothetical protein DRI37_04255 [Chloroflexi bacterium]|nr:MAG: hypothetical protein DRI37_04255 [Chloroflexota bacterium]
MIKEVKALLAVVKEAYEDLEQREYQIDGEVGYYCAYHCDKKILQRLEDQFELIKRIDKKLYLQYFTPLPDKIKCLIDQEKYYTVSAVDARYSELTLKDTK